MFCADGKQKHPLPLTKLSRPFNKQLILESIIKRARKQRVKTLFKKRLARKCGMRGTTSSMKVKDIIKHNLKTRSKNREDYDFIRHQDGVLGLNIPKKERTVNILIKSETIIDTNEKRQPLNINS